MHVSVVDFVYKFRSGDGIEGSAYVYCYESCSFVWLKPSSMSCISCVSKVLVECCDLKPCWVGDSGICGVIRFNMSRSMTLKAVLSSVMGLYEVTSEGSLLGLRIVIMMPCFHVAAILQCE